MRRRWVLPPEAGRRLVGRRASTTLTPVEPQPAGEDRLTSLRCPMGEVGDFSWVPGPRTPEGAIRPPLGCVRLVSRDVRRMSALREVDARSAGFDDLAALHAAWDLHRGEQYPRSSDPWLWVLRWEVEAVNRRLQVVGGRQLGNAP